MAVIKHLDVNTKWLEVIFGYYFADGIIDEEENSPLGRIGIIHHWNNYLTRTKHTYVLHCSKNQFGGVKVWLPSYTRGNFSRWNPCTFKGARFENCSMDVIRKCPYLTFESRHYYQVVAGEVQCWFGHFKSCRSGIFVVRIQGCLRWSYKDFKGIPLHIAQHWIELDTTIPPSHQNRYQMNPNYVMMVKHDLDKILIEGFIVLVEKTTCISPIVVVPKNNGKLHLCWFQETKCSHEKGSISFTIYGGGLGYGS